MTPSSLIRRGGRDAVGTIKASNFSLVRNHCSFSRTARRSKMGMPWSGPRGPLVLRSLARERASSRTWGLTVMIARSPESVGKIRPGTCSSPRQKNRRVFPQIQDRADEYRCGSKRAPFRKVLTKPTPVRIAARQLSARVNARRNARKRWGRVGIGLWIRKSVRTEAKFPSRGSRLASDLRRGVRRVVASLASPVDLRSPESVGKIRPGTCSSPRQKKSPSFPADSGPSR